MGGIGTLAASALIAATLPTAGLTPPIPTADVCAWRQSAIRLYQELAGESGSRARELRTLLADSGVGEPDFLPEQCRVPPGRGGPARDQADEPGSTDDGPAAGSGSGAGSTERTGDDGTTAAERYGWGQPNRVDEFDSPASLADWSIYDGAPAMRATAAAPLTRSASPTAS